MEPATLFILFALAIGLYMAWGIGANDAANSMADAVGARAISLKWAIIAAAICEFAGALLVGAHVTDTVRKGIVDPSVIASLPGLSEKEAAALFVIGMGAALVAAAVWLNVASWLGMPVSTTHAIVGSIVGFGILAAGWSVVNWGKMGQIVASWFISPVAGGVMSFWIFKAINRLILGKAKPVPSAKRLAPLAVFVVIAVVTLATAYKGLTHLTGEAAEWITGSGAFVLAAALGIAGAFVSMVLIRRALRGKENLSLPRQLDAVERVFAPLVIITSCSVAFSHGANDVANSVGPLAAIVGIFSDATVQMKVAVPPWVLAVGGVGIVIGLATYGYRVMHTVGTKITALTPSRGVAADIAAVITVLVCTRLKLPVSTTHTLVGAVFGIGLARGLAAINLTVSRNILASWFVTVPVAAILAMVFFVLGKVLLYEYVLEALYQTSPGMG